MLRPWSARMRCAFVAAGESPYATPDSAAIQSMICRKPSVSYTDMTS